MSSFLLGLMVLVPGQFDHLPPLKPVPATIEEKIERVAWKYKVDSDLALAVARAESNFDPKAKNPLSTASGIFQFLDGTFKQFCLKSYSLTNSMAEKNDPDIQIECAMRMISEGGLSHWYASQHLWKTKK